MGDVTEPDPFESTRMTLGEHLDELRRRLVRGLLALAVSFGVCSFFYEQVAEIVLRPYARAAELVNAAEAEDKEAELLAHPEVPRDTYFEVVGGVERLRVRVLSPQVTSAGESFVFAFKTSLWFALVLGGPVLLWQLWQFIAAGLHTHERRAVLRYFPFSLAFFVGGIVFGYFVVVPYTLLFLGRTFALEDVQPLYTLSSYLTFLSGFTLALGLIFQLPVLIVFCARLGLVRVSTLTRYRGHFVVGAFVVAAVVTPPDPLSQLMLALPMTILFELGIVGARLFARERVPAPATAPDKGALGA